MAKITIIMMVYNEAKFIDKTLSSIQEQNIEDYEIIIGDNASTDGTSEIITQLIGKDSRIAYIKRSKNIGALDNWNDLIRRANGEYVILASGHDLWSKNYLKELASVLDKNSNAVLSFARTQWIDINGDNINVPTSMLDTTSLSGIGKFVSLMYANQDYLYGMMRTDAIRLTRLQKEILGSGEIFLQELAQQGDFVLVDNERWFRRANRSKATMLDKLYRYQSILFSSALKKTQFKFFPHTQMMFCYLMLPFSIKGLTLSLRLSMFFAYPLIILRFIKPFAMDIRWLIK